jgi:type IV pilus assembly protein PilB
VAERLSFESYLVKNEVFPKDALRLALEDAKRRKIPIAKALMETAKVPEESIARAIAQFHGAVYQGGPLVLDAKLIALFPAFTMRRYQFVPLGRTDDEITVASCDPGNVLATDEIRRTTKLKVKVVCVTESTMMEALSRLQSGTVEAGGEEATASSAKHIERILQRSLKRGASDIHFEPGPQIALVRERIDGILHDVETLTVETYNPVLSRLKLMCGMDIVEKRLAQDGRMKMELPSGASEIRASTLPTIYGEKLVLRLLRSANQHPTLDVLDCGEKRLALLKSICVQPDGLILVAGPTGSGKTTTIYSMLNNLDRKTHNVITVEDPVEYEMERANQVQVNSKIGINFLNILPYILRQDPDVIMVGEIREEETAQMVMRAAISGHLVFSTIHAPTALATVSRLTDMGVAPHMLVASLKACISQRLLRKLCNRCKQPRKTTPQDAFTLGLDKGVAVTVFEPKGCDACHGLGYSGRFAAMEILVLKEEMAEAILQRDRSGLARLARQAGFQEIRDHAAERVLAGETSVKEMLARCPSGFFADDMTEAAG